MGVFCGMNLQCTERGEIFFLLLKFNRLFGNKYLLPGYFLLVQQSILIFLEGGIFHPLFVVVSFLLFF